MVLTYENLLRLTDLRVIPCETPRPLNTFNFLSFQDALHYLVRAHRLAGKTILVPSFYCDVTVDDMRKHGLHVVRCRTDYARFDVDLADFVAKLRSESPDIVLLYYFFGKTSVLFQDRAWLQHLKPMALLISDLAHALLPQHRLEFLSEQHLYLDSTRKTTSCMMAHLVMPPGMAVDAAGVARFSPFRYAIRTLFWLKSSCLRLATRTGLSFFSNLGNRLYTLHDHWIGSPVAAFAGFSWDAFLYCHIDFNKLSIHRTMLHDVYRRHLAAVSRAGHLQLFDVPPEEAGNLCFFFAAVVDPARRDPLLTLLRGQGYWVDILWDFDVQQDISEEDRQWARRVIVFPYTLRTQPPHVEHIAALTKTFFGMDI
jgi:hypothetical protein